MQAFGVLSLSERAKRGLEVRSLPGEGRRRKQLVAHASLPLMSLAAAVVLLGCANAPAATTKATTQTTAPSPGGPATSIPSAVPPTAAAQATPSAFTSAQYGYSVVLPAGWSSMAATERWDGESIIHSDAPNVDQFYAPGLAGAWASAAAFKGTLKSYVRKTIADTAKYHGTTCTAPPEAQLSIAFGPDRGTILQFNCGILINIGVTVHEGIGYSFGFRDPTVHVAVDQEDQETFEAILASVQFPA